MIVLKMVTQRLEESGIPYFISGSIAANYYTIPRMTRDIDVVVELRDPGVEKFIEIFKEQFFVDEEVIKNEIHKNGMFNLIHKEFFIKIDFILRKPSPFQDNSFRRRQKVLIEGASMWFISAEDLILAKLLWAKDSHSQMQLRDVQNLLKTFSPIDLVYINFWVSKLQLEDVYHEAQE